MAVTLVTAIGTAKGGWGGKGGQEGCGGRGGGGGGRERIKCLFLTCCMYVDVKQQFLSLMLYVIVSA